MNIDNLQIIFFSPTGTTKKILHNIASNIPCKNLKTINITNPAIRKQQIKTSNNDLLIVGVPVYMGRVPLLASEFLKTITANNTPVVCIVVYGNRAYDDALLELKNIMENCNCKPIAAAAFIGEHSFSSPELPTAHGRPDKNDLKNAVNFGKQIYAKLSTLFLSDSLTDLNIPGIYPYQGTTQLWDVDFIAVDDNCTKCGLCLNSCPTAAINPDNYSEINIKKCITCCACIKICPQNSRKILKSKIKTAAERLHNMYSQRKEPELFL